MSDPQRVELRRSFLRLMALVARRDYLRTIRRRGFVFGTLLLPAAIAGFVLLSTLIAPTFTPEPGAPQPITVVNQSQVELVRPAGVEMQTMELEQARQALATGQLRDYFVIPANYPEQAFVELHSGAEQGGAFEDLQRRGQQEQTLAAVLRSSLLAAQDVPPAVQQRVLQPYTLRDGTGEGPPPGPDFGAGFLLPYAFTFLFVMSIFITSGYLLQSVTEEKENRVVEILLSSVPPFPLMAGKILGLGAAGLTQVAVWVGTALVALPLVGAQLPMFADLQLGLQTLLLALAFFALGYLAYGAIFAAIGAIAPGTREAQQYSGFFGFFAVIPLIFAGAFLADPGSPVVIILSLIPLTAPAAMLQVLALAPQPPWPLVIVSLLSLALFAALAAIAAARIFRATLLLYGNRPSVRGIISAVSASD